MNELSMRARFEQYRLTVISSWPESDAKRAALASARYALERELARSRPSVEPIRGGATTA